MKIIINENQVKLLNEGLADSGIDEGMRESIALWCLINDFRYFIPNNVFGNKVNVANNEEINKEICNDIMNAVSITEADNEKELFGNDEYNDFKIYKVETQNEIYLIEVSNQLTYYYCETTFQDYADGVYDGDCDYLIEWFGEMYR